MKCPYCNEEIPESSQICPVCGEEIKQETKTISKKVCPFCNEEIDKNLKICPHCGESPEKPIEIDVKILKKFFIVLVSSILSLTLAIGGIYFVINNLPIGKNDISIVAKPNDMNNKSKSDILKRIGTEEAILDSYLKGNHTQENKDKLFLSFHKHLENYAYNYGYIYNYTGGAKMYDGQETFQEDGIEYITTFKRGWVSKIKTTSPDGKVFNFNYDKGLYFLPVIDYDYLIDNYSDYLSKPVNYFLSVQSSFYKDLKGQLYWNVVNDYYEGDYYPFPNKRYFLKKWAKQVEIFLREYPEFPLRGTAKNYYDAYKYGRDIDINSPLVNEDSLELEKEGMLDKFKL